MFQIKKRFDKKRWQERFIFNSQEYQYWPHLYERTIEIPIAKVYLDRYHGENILEVGNVLHGYIPEVRHEVVDKYEQKEGVINEDIINFQSDKKYRLILCISTMEHIGYDEDDKDPDKIVKTITKLKGMLDFQGVFIFTSPVGYNPYLDKLIFNHQLDGQHYFLKRQDKQNHWKQISNLEELREVKYDYPFDAANAVSVNIIESDQ